MPRTKEQNKEIRESTRKTILDSALKLFSKKGFHGTSINEISKAAKISKGLSYNYFKSKEEILDSIIERFLRETEEIAAHAEETDDPYNQLQRIIEDTFSMLGNKEEEWRFLSALMVQPDISSNAARLSKDFMKMFVSKVRKIFKRIGVKNPEAEAYILSAMIDGTIIYYLYDSENFPLKKVVRHIKKKYSREELETKITS